VTPVRIAHATDIHWYVPAGAWELIRAPKRLVGTANLVLRGRRHQFDRGVQDALVAHIVALAPDAVCLTGDLTSTATEAEFRAAREAIDPIVRSTPTFIIPGNHDRYTWGAHRGDRIRAHLGDWMGTGSPVPRRDIGDVTLLGLDPNHPTGLDARGDLPQDQLDGLAAALAEPDLAGRTVVLCIHYPLLDRRGAVYDDRHHGLVNAQAVIDVLRAAPVRPAVILCGHEHHGYRADLDLGDAVVPVIDCGSSGCAPRGARAAAMCVIEVEGGRLTGIERYRWDRNGFALEAGGAFASGS
jgi:3',5'-cyclic AMP phosphodiesterase CpdA